MPQFKTSKISFILGNDIAGIVAAVGTDVTDFQIGDAVYGMIGFPDKGGAYAEYAAVPSKAYWGVCDHCYDTIYSEISFMFEEGNYEIT